MKKQIKTSLNSRWIVANLLKNWFIRPSFLDALIPRDINDRPFVTEVLYGVIRWKRLLNWYLRQIITGIPEKKLIPFLWTGLYQIMFMDNVTDYAAVNETVEAVKQEGCIKNVAFVNAVLRSALRKKKDLIENSKKLPIGIRLSHPDILINKWKKQFGNSKTEKLCNWNNSVPAIFIHPNLNLISMDEFKKKLQNHGINTIPHPVYPSLFLELPHGVKIRELPGYKEGLFSVHDPSTILAVKMLNPVPGETVLDACASPGGKTILIAEKMHNNGKLFAMDVDKERLKILRENIKRMKLQNVNVICGDACRANNTFQGLLFDKILADVPCSNTGVIRRKPDVKWHFSQKSMNTLIKLQITLLNGLISLVKPGGYMVYSTCSIEHEEGKMLIERWCNDHPEVKLIKSATNIPPANAMDGIFVALLQRTVKK